MVKFKNPFKLVQKKDDYREKDQRIVSRWLKELEEEKLNDIEIINLVVKLVVCVVSSIRGTTAYERKFFVKTLDQRMKETFTIVNREKNRGKFDDDE